MYLISLYFDDVTNERIQSYMNQIAKRTGNDVMLADKVPPHITLSAFETTQESEAEVRDEQSDAKTDSDNGVERD